MAVRVGINGFGRIGRNLFRAAKAAKADIDFVAVNDLTDAKTLAHLLKYDSILGPYPGTVEVDGNDLVVDGDRLQRPHRARPGRAAVGRPRRRGRHRVDRLLHQARRRRQAPRGRRQEGRHLRPGHRAGRHRRPRRQLRLRLRQGQPPRHLQRVVHDELPRAVRQGHQRHGRHQARPDDDDPRLHGRPAPAGHAALRPAPRPRRRAEPDPGLDRRRQGRRPRAARAQRQAVGLRRPRPRPDRLRRRPHLRGRARDVRRRRSTRR